MSSEMAGAILDVAVEASEPEPEPGNDYEREIADLKKALAIANKATIQMADIALSSPTVDKVLKEALVQTLRKRLVRWPKRDDNDNDIPGSKQWRAVDECGCCWTTDPKLPPAVERLLNAVQDRIEAGKGKDKG